MRDDVCKEHSMQHFTSAAAAAVAAVDAAAAAVAAASVEDEFRTS